MQKRYKIMLAAGVLVLACQLAYAWWNPSELVTLHGKDIPVADAFKSFSKQTGRKIFFPASLDQKVTLNLERVPLEDALEVATDQANLSHVRVFILSSDATRKNELLNRLSQETEQPVMMQLARNARWTDSTGTTNRAPGTITYKADAKAVDTVIAEINMATGSYFYFSGDFPSPISVDWQEIPVKDAAGKLASITDTDKERIYQVFDRTQAATSGRPRRSEFSFEDLDRWYEKTEAQIATLPPAEKAVAEEQFKKQQERMEEFAALSPEKRMERMMQRFAGGNQEERLIRRLKNSTPESRAKRYQRFEARRQASGSGTPPPANPKPANP